MDTQEKPSQITVQKSGPETEAQRSNTARLQRADRRIPVKAEEIAVGSMGKVSRLYYADGSTRIAKNALGPADNKNLQNEYFFMSFLENPRKVPGIPRVYEEFPPRDPAVDTYGFTMEDLQGYKGLLDLKTGVDLTVHMDTEDKLLVLQDLYKTLAYANAEQVIYNDVALQNIMIDKTASVKLVDWGNAQWSNEKNHLSDVNQTAEMLPELFNGEDFIPPSLRQWLRKVQDKGFMSAMDAWSDFNRAWGVAFTDEFDATETRRKEAFGKVRLSAQFGK